MSEKSSEKSLKSNVEDVECKSNTEEAEFNILSNEDDAVKFTVECFALVKNPINGNTEVVRRYTWSNATGMSVQVITYGAIITSMKVPDRNGVCEDVVLGFDDIEGYQKADNPYFGAAVGRVANRIGGAEFCLEGKTFTLAKNIGEHHLHGGIIGFDKFNWTPYVQGTVLKLTHTSDDGYEGYPGAVMVTIAYELTKDNCFNISYNASSSNATPINLTNHSYFNLAGHGAGHRELYRHIVTINADKITETDEDSIPTGKFLCVGGTPFDFRVPKELGPAMAKVPTLGYDDNFCITKGTKQGMAFVSRTLHPHSGRILEVYSDQPGVQFYTSNSMPDPEGSVRTKNQMI